jgi:hypothetical protein
MYDKREFTNTDDYFEKITDYVDTKNFLVEKEPAMFL